MGSLGGLSMHEELFLVNCKHFPHDEVCKNGPTVYINMSSPCYMGIIFCLYFGLYLALTSNVIQMSLKLYRESTPFSLRYADLGIDLFPKILT